MSFLDIKKAFDAVKRSKVWEALVKIEIPNGLIERIRETQKSIH